jgi:hypothetical protein
MRQRRNLEGSVDAGVQANARLTGYAAVALLVPLAVVWVTGLFARRLLDAHVLVGLLLVPLVLLKLGSVGYRFVRYYMREPRYAAAGPPSLPMRLLGPVVVLLTIAVFGTGIELWLFGARFGRQWTPFHHASAYLWFAAMAVHAGAYVRRAPRLAAADSRDHLAGALTRRSLVVASLVMGIVLAVALLPFPSPFSFAVSSGQ